MQVLKFGGSSVANATNILKVESIVRAALERGRVILICSAIKGCTDTLIEIGRRASSGDASYKDLANTLKAKHLAIVDELLPEAGRASAKAEVEALFAEMLEIAVTRGTTDEVQTFGELLSTHIIARRFAADGVKVLWLDSRELVRVGDTAATYANIAAAVLAGSGIELFVAPGFVASDAKGRHTTLGRGGSDYSAALYAAGSKADTLEIWTDVPGIMTANPKVVPSARTIPHISYRAALDLANYGAKVLYAPTVQPAMDAGIAISILNTFEPGATGTVIEARPPRSKFDILGISNMASDVAGRELICAIGTDSMDVLAMAGRFGKALEGLDCQGLHTKGTNIFATVPSDNTADAMLALHRELFEQKTAEDIDIYLAGYGAVGHALLEIIAKNRDRIAERTGKNLRLVGIANRNRFAIDRGGLDINKAKELLAGGESAANGAYISAIEGDYLRRSVFVDCTGSETIGLQYGRLFKKGIRVVSCNRRAFAVPYAQYVRMKTEAAENGVSLRYGTTVGAALPVLESISSGANSSDEIISIEAAVSCTLNYIISNYDGTKSDALATLLKRAQDEGLTESDPRVDLGGRDAMRKLLILAREAGIPLEEDDVQITPFLAPGFFDCELDEFYERLAAYEPQFVAREAELDAAEKHQRFVASVVKDPSARLGYKASIHIQEVGPESPFYQLSGTENVICIKSTYITSPLVIRGDGEGARLAASGVINDILHQ